MKTAFLILPLAFNVHAAQELYTSWDFDQNNVVSTNPLPQPGVAEPMVPTSEQLGPQWTAKGKPFYSPDGIGSSQTGWTVAPGTNYQVGIESSCKRQGTSSECIRDNAMAIEVSGNPEETIVNAGVQDKAFLQLFDVSASDPLYVEANKQTVVHHLNFDMKFDRFYEVSKSANMHMQSFQPGCGPALAVKVEKHQSSDGVTPLAKPIQIYVEVMRNNAASETETIKVCEGIVVNRNDWNNFYFKLAPGSGKHPSQPRNFGRLFLYVNDIKVCEFSDNWGMLQNKGVSCSNGHRIDIGSYGGRTLERRKVYFDNVRYGVNQDLVRPGKSRVSMSFNSNQ